MTQSDYLERRRQPHTEEAFFEKYHLTMDGGRRAVEKVLKTYKVQNPKCNIGYERSFNEENLTIIFTLAGKEYARFMLVVENEPCYCLPLHMWLDNIHKRMETEDDNGNK